jgi:hypothetical protein
MSELGNPKTILTAATAPLSRANVNTSSPCDAFVALKSHDIIAIHGVEARNKFISVKRTRSSLLTGRCHIARLCLGKMYQCALDRISEIVPQKEPAAPYTPD